MRHGRAGGRRQACLNRTLEQRRRAPLRVRWRAPGPLPTWVGTRLKSHERLPNIGGMVGCFRPRPAAASRCVLGMAQFEWRKKAVRN